MRYAWVAWVLFGCGGGVKPTKDVVDGDAVDSGSVTAVDSGETLGWRPTLFCPGDPQCPTAEGNIEVGASAVSITPTCFEQWLDCGDDGLCPGDDGWVEPDSGEGNSVWHKATEAFLDCGCDQLCPDEPGYPGPDEGEADGEFQAIWLAGFQNSRPANSVHDDLWARTVVFRQGETSVAVVSLDSFGFFFDDVQEVRAAVAEEGIDVDHVLITSTHDHESPDTLGQYGQVVGKRGVDDAWMIDLKSAVVESIGQAVRELQPAEMTVTSVDLSTVVPEKGTRNFVNDKRDPRIVDEMMGVAIFRSTSDGSVIASMINFGNHPEALASGNTAITSDFPHYIRDGMENGVPWNSGEVEGLGGVSVYIQGAVGGMMTPLGVEVSDRDGNAFSEATFEKAKAIGHMMATAALESLEMAEPVTAPGLAFRTVEFTLPIANNAFQAMFLIGVFDRQAINYDPDIPLDDDNVPELPTEMDLIDVGPLRMLSIPGELLPELAVGGYDGSHTNIGDYTDAIFDPDQPHPPDFSKAPEGPYLKERMAGEFNWIVGLGNDELGYIIPEYNFILDDRVPYLIEAEGHYEETNSMGPQTAPLIEEWADRLISWNPEGETN